MDKIRDVENSFNHTVQINERKNIIITGVKKLENFNEEEFLIEASMGYILLKGENLELLKLDTFQGTVSIKGKINNLNYLDDNSKKIKTESILLKRINDGIIHIYFLLTLALGFILFVKKTTSLRKFIKVNVKKSKLEEK